MSDSWPTFDKCPECGSLLLTDSETTGAWCSACDYSFEQAELDL